MTHKNTHKYIYILCVCLTFFSFKCTVKSPKFGCFSRSFYCHAFNYSHISLGSFNSHSLFTPLYDGTNEKSLCLMV